MKNKYRKYIEKFYVLLSDFGSFSNVTIIIKIHSIRKVKEKNIFRLYYTSKERLKDLKGTSDTGWTTVDSLEVLDRQTFNSIEEAKLFAQLSGVDYFICITDGLLSAEFDEEIFFLGSRNNNE